jgi:hypothetical protein
LRSSTANSRRTRSDDTDAGDDRLSAKATALEQHQAFADLSKMGVAVEVSPPFPIEWISKLPFRRA